MCVLLSTLPLPPPQPPPPKWKKKGFKQKGHYTFWQRKTEIAERALELICVLDVFMKMCGYELKTSISLYSEIPWEELYSIMNFQHLFMFFYPDSLIVPHSSYDSIPTLFFLVSPGYTVSSHCCSQHHSLLSYLPTLFLGLSFWILATALSSSSVNSVTQPLTLPALL